MAEISGFMAEISKPLLLPLLNLFICRDLKPENILLTSKGPDAVLKVIDYGTSECCKPGQRLSQKFGTPYYVAPEVRPEADSVLLPSTFTGSVSLCIVSTPVVLGALSLRAWGAALDAQCCFLERWFVELAADLGCCVCTVCRCCGGITPTLLMCGQRA
jgi:serine/threonine protein kinase